MVATADALPAGVQMELTEALLTAEQLVVRIQSYNPTATASYLAQFSVAALERYLDHLACTSEPRGRAARWERPGDTPAILAFRDALED